MVRYFSYIDEQTINSFYNQLDTAYDLERKNKSVNKSITGEIKISLKNIILGLLDNELGIISEESRGTYEERERSVKIEYKIMELIKIAKGSENKKIDIDDLKNKRQLICSTVKVIDCNKFLEYVSNIYKKRIKDYNEFLEFYIFNKNITWNDIVDNLTYENMFGSGVDILKIMDNWYQKDDNLFSFIVIDSGCPIIIDMSYKKITMPHSSMRSAGFFGHFIEFNVIGILTETNNCFFLKPLALWNLIDDEEAEHQISHIYKQ